MFVWNLGRGTLPCRQMMTERERDRQRQTETDRQRETQRDSDRETQRERVGEGERQDRQTDEQRNTALHTPNQRTREIISARETSHKHSSKDLNRQQSLSPSMRVNTTPPEVNALHAHLIRQHCLCAESRKRETDGRREKTIKKLREGQTDRQTDRETMLYIPT